MLFWGAAFSVTEVALRHTTPAFTAFSRGLFGFLVLLPFLGLFGARLPRTRRVRAIARRVRVFTDLRPDPQRPGPGRKAPNTYLRR